MNPRVPLLVGTVIVAAAASLTYFVMSTTKEKFNEASTYYLYADFTDASGIRWKTRVQIAGIDVGRIESISHARNPEGRLLARVKLRILKEYDVYDNAVVRKVAESLLGDFRLDVDPGTPDHRKLKEGDVIPNVQSQSDLDQIQHQLRQVSQNVNDITASFAKVLAGPEGEGSLKAIMQRVENSMRAIEEATTALSGTLRRNDQTIDQLIKDLGAFTSALAAGTKPGGDVRQITENLAEMTRHLNKIAAGLENMVSEGGPESKSIRNTLDRLNDSLANLDSIARKINSGQGTLGRVVNDPSIAEHVEQTLSDASEIIGGLSRIDTQIELRSEYDIPFQSQASSNPLRLQPSIKNTLGLWIIPRPDKAYILEAISDPRGYQTNTVTTTTPKVAGASSTTIQTLQTSYNALKFSAEFAKRYGPLLLRFGIIENTGGLGFNLYALKDRAELRFDAFDFTRTDQTKPSNPISPRLRSYAMYEFVNHLYVMAGIDDPLNSQLFTWYMGGVLRFSDEDLRSMLLIAPKP
jgi:phospholipid/cholesterol/gamma-HCH transport system substrate-binding protein